MSSIHYIRMAFIAFALLMGGLTVQAAAPGETPAHTAVATVAKAETEKTKAKPAPKKKAAKEKAPAKLKKKAAAKEKSTGKTKTKAKGKTKEPAKTLKAKAAPAKGSKKKAAAAAAAADDDFNGNDYNDESGDAGLWFMLALGVLAVCGLGFLVWLEYRPTVYPSGKTYGQFDYLPAARGGAFTTEFGADPVAQWGAQQRAPERSDHQPATVTREPLHSTRKTEQVPRTKESA